MFDDEVTQVRIKARYPDLPARFVRLTDQGAELVSYEQATLFESLDQALDMLGRLAERWPSATLSAIEEGWSGIFPDGFDDSAKAFWRH